MSSAVVMRLHAGCQSVCWCDDASPPPSDRSGTDDAAMGGGMRGSTCREDMGAVSSVVHEDQQSGRTCMAPSPAAAPDRIASEGRGNDPAVADGVAHGAAVMAPPPNARMEICEGSSCGDAADSQGARVGCIADVFAQI